MDMEAAVQKCPVDFSMNENWTELDYISQL